MSEKNKKQDERVEDLIKKVTECFEGKFTRDSERLGIILTQLVAERDEAVRRARDESNLVLCSRTGIHTCRLGAVHIPDELMEQIKALTPPASDISSEGNSK